MSLHTSQHLLSAVLDTRNLPTLSWSLTPYPQPCYVEIPRALTVDEIVSVQEQANRLVFEGRKVYVEVEELHEDVIKQYDGPSVGIPVDYTGGVKRTVIIDGVDRSQLVLPFKQLGHTPLTDCLCSSCCGTQMPSLHNLQLFLLPHTESLARASTTSARLYFVAGPRLITYLGAAHNALTATAGTLSCGAPDVPTRVEQVVEDRRRATKRVEDLEGELAGVLARDMLAAELGEAKSVVVHKHREDDSGNALVFLSAISTAFVSELAARAQPVPYLVVLSSSPSTQTSSTMTIVMIFGDDEKRVRAVGDGLKAKLGVKGGGKGTKWSGKFTGVWKANREGVAVDEILHA